MGDIADVTELHGGHQAHVYLVTLTSGDTFVAKLIDASFVDRSAFTTRVAVVAGLADLDGRVCRPLPIASRSVTDVAVRGVDHLLVCWEHADGDALTSADAELMGATLGGLHRSMAQLPRAGLPCVAALHREPRPDDQLLHGDFNAGNLRRRGDTVRVFDLDDCGYGPPAFDVANALYMMLFDAVVEEAPDAAAATYAHFRSSFAAGYASASDAAITDADLDRFIGVRVAALSGWLDDLDGAPIGIRTASPEWLATLRSFVAAWEQLRPSGRCS